jgi:hypothetical protein
MTGGKMNVGANEPPLSGNMFSPREEGEGEELRGRWAEVEGRGGVRKGGRRRSAQSASVWRSLPSAKENVSRPASSEVAVVSSKNVDNYKDVKYMPVSDLKVYDINTRKKPKKKEKEEDLVEEAEDKEKSKEEELNKKRLGISGYHLGTFGQRESFSPSSLLPPSSIPPFSLFEPVPLRRSFSPQPHRPLRVSTHSQATVQRVPSFLRSSAPFTLPFPTSPPSVPATSSFLTLPSGPSISAYELLPQLGSINKKRIVRRFFLFLFLFYFK